MFFVSGGGGAPRGGAAPCLPEAPGAPAPPPPPPPPAPGVAGGGFPPPPPPRGGGAGPGGGGGPPPPTVCLPAGGLCRVAATLTPTPDSDITIEVWLPAAGWNGKFQAVGNGGWAGVISYAAMADALRRGYATSSTDTGHTGATGAFALGHPEKFVDFAYRSEHEMTVKSKAVIDAFYGRGPRWSYWNGCSTGGRQGLAEAQRFPDDYDGIIAGASANPRTYLNSWQLSIAQAMLKDPAGFIPPARYPMIHQAVVAACDAIDGVKDGLIGDPTRCHFDPQVLACAGTEGPSCLTPAQIAAARVVMSPVRDPRSGVELFPGLEAGTELAWAGLVGGPERWPPPFFYFFFFFFTNGVGEFFFFFRAAPPPREKGGGAGTINAVNPDLSRFAGHGGKLLLYHGWSDGSVAPRASVNYYTSVVRTMGGERKTAEWIRLFMVPGMGHCGGGEGPNTFDTVTALEQWVEQGKAPNRIIASRVAGASAERTRPLCPYPQVAAYVGTGSVDEAASFVCK